MNQETPELEVKLKLREDRLNELMEKDTELALYKDFWVLLICKIFQF
jgi:hypothetical protein